MEQEKSARRLEAERLRLIDLALRNPVVATGVLSVEATVKRIGSGQRVSIGKPTYSTQSLKK